MLRSRETAGFATLLVGLIGTALCVAAQTSAGPARNPAPAGTAIAVKPAAKQKTHSKKSQPVVEVQQAPPAPPTLEQQPPTPPQVTYRDGQLAITSTNATLSQVLRSVQTQTGAMIDLPPGAGNERVVATLGPGKPQAVLASLLNGSKFNFVILGDPHNPGSVQKVILLSKSAGGVTEPQVNASAQYNFRPQPPVGQPQQGIEPPEDEYPQNEPEAENPGQQPGLPGMPGSENLQPDVVNPGNRTPEQMLQELQRMQQQQQQMNQQLNPANQQPFGQPVVPPPQNQQPAPFPNQQPNQPQ